MWPIKTRGIFLASESSLSRGAMAPFSRAGITEFPVRVFSFCFAERRLLPEGSSV